MDPHANVYRALLRTLGAKVSDAVTELVNVGVLRLPPDPAQPTWLGTPCVLPDDADATPTCLPVRWPDVLCGDANHFGSLGMLVRPSEGVVAFRCVPASSDDRPCDLAATAPLEADFAHEEFARLYEMLRNRACIVAGTLELRRPLAKRAAELPEPPSKRKPAAALAPKKPTRRSSVLAAALAPLLPLADSDAVLASMVAAALAPLVVDPEMAEFVTLLLPEQFGPATRAGAVLRVCAEAAPGPERMRDAARASLNAL
jgi:hypothetical protein